MYFEIERLYISERIRLIYSLLLIVPWTSIGCYRLMRYKNYSNVDDCAPDAVGSSVVPGSRPTLFSAASASKTAFINRLASSRPPDVAPGVRSCRQP